MLVREPEPRRWVPEGRLESVLSVFADFVDQKSPFTAGHSSEVASLAAEADGGTAVTLRRAGLVHDLGRAAVPNGIWDKPGPPTEGEWERVRLHPCTGPAFMRDFVRHQVRPGVELPPPAAPPPPWMETRPAGVAAMMAAFPGHPFDRAAFRGCRFPVLLGYGDLTAEHEEVRAAILARLLPDIRIRRFEGIHHFTPPEQIYTSDHVCALQDLWRAGRPPDRDLTPTFSLSTSGPIQG